MTRETYIELSLQVTGFLAALLALIFHAPSYVFVLAFAVHLSGDLIFVWRDKLMSFDIEQFVKLPTFLQFVGVMVLAGAMFFSGAGFAWKAIGFLGFGFSLAGFVYEKIYQ